MAYYKRDIYINKSYYCLYIYIKSGILFIYNWYSIYIFMRFLRRSRSKPNPNPIPGATYVAPGCKHEVLTPPTSTYCHLLPTTTSTYFHLLPPTPTTFAYTNHYRYILPSSTAYSYHYSLHLPLPPTNTP